MDGRGEADVRSLQPGSGVPRADETRSPYRRPAARTPRGAHPRLRRDRRPDVPGDAADPGNGSGQAAEAQRPDAAAPRGRHPHPNRLSPRCRPCGRGHAPRRQTAQHPGHPRRLRLPRRLRHRQRHHRREDHATGHRGGHLEIHGPRTVYQRRGHVYRRRLLPVLRAVRVYDRGSAVPIGQPCRIGQLAHDRPDSAAQREEPGRPQSARRRGRPRHGEETRRPLPHRRRPDASRP
ncbi:hypothetical protein MYIN104542_27600 [Mycobacterium intermedium]